MEINSLHFFDNHCDKTMYANEIAMKLLFSLLCCCWLFCWLTCWLPCCVATTEATNSFETTNSFASFIQHRHCHFDRSAISIADDLYFELERRHARLKIESADCVLVPSPIALELPWVRPPFRNVSLQCDLKCARGIYIQLPAAFETTLLCDFKTDTVVGMIQTGFIYF